MGQNLRDCNRIVSSLMDLNLQDSLDVFSCSLHSAGRFSVKSMYAFYSYFHKKFGVQRCQLRSRSLCGI